MTLRQRKPIDIDGTTLEGGGQILRLALALSSLTETPIHLDRIRGNRGTKAKDGGIKQAHLGGAAWLTRACEAATDGLALRSRELLFEPGLATANELKDVQKAVANDGVTIGQAFRKFHPSTKSSNLEPIWTDVVENGKLIRRETSIALSTPGSVFAVLQATLPFILFRSEPRSRPSQVPLRVTIDGGTNVWHSMSYEWAEHVLFPLLHAKLGIGPITMELHRRSWSTGPKSIGSVTFTIPPFPSSSPLPAFSFTDRGLLSKIAVFVFAPSPSWQTALLDSTQNILTQHFPDHPQEVIANEISGHSARLYLLLVAHTENGYRLGRDWLYAEKLVADKMEKITLRMARQVADDLKRELDHGGCVDEYLQDQLVVFQVLAHGKAKVERNAEASLHTQTARWVAETICGVKFDEEGSCDGLGYSVKPDAGV